MVDEYEVKPEKIHIKEWKKDVYVRPITFEEQLQWEGSIDEKNPGHSIALLVSMAACDAAGNQLWDVARVNKISAKIVRQLHMACAKISGLRKKDHEELLKNFDADQPE